MLTNERQSALLHVLHNQVTTDTPDIRTQERAGRPMRGEGVSVVAPPSGEPRIKARLREFSGTNQNRRTAQAIQSSDQLLGVDTRRVSIKGNDLSPRVHTLISSTGPHDGDRMAQDSLQGVLKRSSNGLHAQVLCEPVKAASVVRDEEPNPPDRLLVQFLRAVGRGLQILDTRFSQC